MRKIKKQNIVESLKSTLQEASLVVVLHQKSMTVQETQDLRQKMRQAQSFLKVAKNTLIKIAVSESRHYLLSDYLKGSTVLAFSKDQVSAAKVVYNYAKSNNKIELICGVMDGQLLDREAVESLATLPSINELRSKLVSTILAPADKLYRVLRTPPSQLVRLLAANASKNQ